MGIISGPLKAGEVETFCCHATNRSLPAIYVIRSNSQRYEDGIHMGNLVRARVRVLLEGLFAVLRLRVRQCTSDEADTSLLNSSAISSRAARFARKAPMVSATTNTTAVAKTMALCVAGERAGYKLTRDNTTARLAPVKLGTTAALWPARQAASLAITFRIRMPATGFTRILPFAHA